MKCVSYLSSYKCARPFQIDTAFTGSFICKKILTRIGFEFSSTSCCCNLEHKRCMDLRQRLLENILNKLSEFETVLIDYNRPYA